MKDHGNVSGILSRHRHSVGGRDSHYGPESLRMADQVLDLAVPFRRQLPTMRNGFLLDEKSPIDQVSPYGSPPRATGETVVESIPREPS